MGTGRTGTKPISSKPVWQAAAEEAVKPVLLLKQLNGWHVSSKRMPASDSNQYDNIIKPCNDNEEPNQTMMIDDDNDGMMMIDNNYCYCWY